MRSLKVTLALIMFVPVTMMLVACSKEKTFNHPPLEDAEPTILYSIQPTEESSPPQEHEQEQEQEHDQIIIPEVVMLKPEIYEFNSINEQHTKLQIPVESRYGTLILQSDGEALLQTNKNAKRYTGDFNVLYSDDPNGDGDMKVIDQFPAHIEEDVKAWRWEIVEFDGFDLLMLKANQNEFNKHHYNRAKTTRFFVVPDQKDAFLLQFLVHSDEGEAVLEELTVHSDYQPTNTPEHLIVISPPTYQSEQPQQLTFEIDLAERLGRLIEVNIMDEPYPNLSQLVEEQARLLEVILFYGVGDSQHVIDATEESWQDLLQGVSDQALQSASYQYISKNKMNFPRSFYWGASDVHIDEQGNNLFFTFTANLAYAVGQDFRLQVHMTRNNDKWQFENFGSLYIEQLQNSPKVIIEDDILNKYSATIYQFLRLYN